MILTSPQQIYWEGGGRFNNIFFSLQITIMDIFNGIQMPNAIEQQ